MSRQRFFTPRLKFKSYEDMNAWLLDRCVAYAKTQNHPEFKDETRWAVFERERAHLVPFAGPFDGFHATPASVSKTCPVHFDGNKYSVCLGAAVWCAILTAIKKLRAMESEGGVH